MMKFAKIKIEKGQVNSCMICDLYSAIREKADETFQKAKELYPDADYKDIWNAMEGHGVNGYKIKYARPRRENEDDWKGDVIENNVGEICEECFNKLVKCYTRIDDAEEIAFSAKESYKSAPGFTPDEFVIEGD